MLALSCKPNSSSSLDSLTRKKKSKLEKRIAPSFYKVSFPLGFVNNTVQAAFTTVTHCSCRSESKGDCQERKGRVILHILIRWMKKKPENHKTLHLLLHLDTY